MDEALVWFQFESCQFIALKGSQKLVKELLREGQNGEEGH